MKCQHCSGEVTWRGPLSNLTHTQCDGCGRINCQEVDALPEDDDAAEWEHPCPFRGEPTKTPAGEACSACGLRESHINDTAASAPRGAAGEGGERMPLGVSPLNPMVSARAAGVRGDEAQEGGSDGC